MITVISGTNRPNSKSNIVAKYCCDILINKNIESQFLSLSSLPNDFMFSEMYQKHSVNYELLIDKYISKAQKFIFVIPEYNGSFPGVLKAFMDSLDYLSLKGKKRDL